MTANDSPNLAHCLLIAFYDLEKWKQKNFYKKKQYAGVRANIEQKPYGATLGIVCITFGD